MPRTLVVQCTQHPVRAWVHSKAPPGAAAPDRQTRFLTKTLSGGWSVGPMLAHQCGGCCAHWCAAHGPNRASVRVAKPASTIASPTCGLVSRRPTRVLGLRRVARNLRCAQAQARRSFGYDPPIVPKRSDGTSFGQPSYSG